MTITKIRDYSMDKIDKTYPSIIFIVPYRERENQKLLFETYMKYLLEDYKKSNYEILFAHQRDNRPFNRGAMKNIGFIAIKEKYPDHYKDITIVFNDVDTMPYKKNLLDYEITKNSGIIKHFYGFEFALGGIFSIKGQDFEHINGFPNYWGWGLEDNVIQKRATNNKIVIDRSNFYPIHSPEILQIHTDIKRLVSNRQPGFQELSNHNHKTNMNTDGINSISKLQYSIDTMKNNNYMINITDFETPNKPENDKYFYQNLSKNNKLIDKRLEKTQKHRFRLTYS